MEEVKTCEAPQPETPSPAPSPTSPRSLFLAIPDAARVLGFSTEAFYQATSRHKDPLPHVVREIKLGSDSGPRPEVALADFCLKAQVVDLWNRLDQLGTGTVEVLEVKHGLPFQIVVPEVTA